jgi:hypothetical protein
MARKQKPEGKAKVKSFSYPQSTQNKEMIEFISAKASEKNISESELIVRILNHYYLRQKGSNT